MAVKRYGDRAYRYLHLDGDWPRDAELGIDVATPKAVETLTTLAQDTVRRANKAQLQRLFLSRRED